MCGMTRRIILLAGCLLAGFSVRAQLQERNIVIDSVRVTARRVLKDIGTQKSALDTVALRESVTNSLAEVLSQNSPVFIKSYGRATLATASVRGTAPSHTQVTWNGMKLNSPMLGMVDFSMIPSYFIDDANLYYGASSVNVAGGGLGGAVALGTRAADAEGFALRYVQGVSSYTTFDEFLRLSYGKGRWRAATRAYYASSKNDFHYTNYRKKVFDTNQQGNIVGYSYPRERNRNGSFNDLHLLQEFYLNSASGNRWNLAAWYIASRRGVPMLNVDYRDESESRNRQRENTLRVAGGWERSISRLKLAVRAGYSYTDLVYTYAGDAGNGTLTEMIRSESRAHTAFARAEAEYYFTDRLLLMANLSADQSVVSSIDRAAGHTTGDYDKARVEYSGFLSVKYRPAERLGLALSLREERYGYDWTPWCRPLSPTTCFRAGVGWSSRPPCRATSAIRPSTTSISSRAATIRCVPSGDSSATSAPNSPSAANTGGGACGAKCQPTTPVSATGLSGCPPSRGSGRRSMSARCTATAPSSRANFRSVRAATGACPCGATTRLPTP